MAAAVLAAVLPPLLAYNLPPSSTLLNQCLAVALWGALVLMLAPARLSRQALALQAALALMALGVLLSWSAALPSSLALSALGLLAAAAVLAWAGVEAARQRDGVAVFEALAAGLLAAGALSALVAVVQVFAPSWADGLLIAQSGTVGRAVGNLRQPNHLCSLLLWAAVAAVALLELRRLSRGVVAALLVLLVFAVELSASRTGAVGLLLLAAWGLLDRRLSRGARGLLLATPLLYALAYGGVAAWGAYADQMVGAEARLAATAGIESANSRPRIWSNALALIARQPWTGVGFGEFNLAWSLTPFPGRPTAFFDHTHTLPLQLAVELGLPLATLVLALLGLALWQAWQRSARVDGDAGLAGRAALLIVLMIGLHSLVEYPLWYAYFLLPAAFAWGFALGTPAGDALPPRRSPVGLMLGLAVLVGGALAMLDYMRVVVIYAPPANAAPLDERIARGQRSWLFAHHADYAAATTDDQPGHALGLQRAPHQLLDTRLMIAWARDLAAHGQLDLARTLAARLREFRNPDADEFFAPCARPGAAEFQCQPPQAAHGWREFVPPLPAAAVKPQAPSATQ